MSDFFKILTIVGARPQFIKSAPVSRAFSNNPLIEEITLHTGQHYDVNMSEIFFDQLKLPIPKYNLNIHGGPHGRMTGRMLEAIEKVIELEMPEGMVVYGDTNSTLAGALAAAKLNVPIFHIEAGLRSYNRQMPEEINRVLVDHVSNLLFCPTGQAVESLKLEGITEGVFQVGDVMFDSCLLAREANKSRPAAMSAQLRLEGAYGICTVHRESNTRSKDSLQAIVDFIAREFKEIPLLWPVHPRIRNLINSLDKVPQNIRFIDPLGYFDLQDLLTTARIVLTDSGGLQKEAYFNRVECVTLRDETEWGETITHGWNRLWTVEGYQTRKEIIDYGSGNASRIITDKLVEFLRSKVT